ncbi:MAG: sodium:proline symporter [Candidatus Methylomirabilia bacterium]
MRALSIALVALASLFFMATGIAYARRRVRTVEDFISARSSTGVLVTSATLVATVMGAWVLASPAEIGASGGLIALIGYGVGSAAPILVFMGVGQRMRALMPEGHSLTEYVWHRYGGGMYWFTLAVIVFYMFIFLAAELTAISLAVNLVAGIPYVITAAIVGIATLLYTAHGGLRAVIFTDTIQFIFILPLLVLVLVAVMTALGGVGAVVEQVRVTAPELLDLGYRPGVELAIVLTIAILAANLFHQGYWQRVWTASDARVLRRAFGLSALTVIPIVFLTGLFGMIAKGAGIVEHPSGALFELVNTLSPWAVWAVLLLAIALVMSSVDSLLNGLVSAFTSDLWRMRPRIPPARLLWWARLLTVAVALPAVAIAFWSPSVLYLFFIADLVSAAAVFPVFYGLYVRRYNGAMAMVSALVGLVVGALFFPLPDFSRGVLFLQPSLLYSFLGALLAAALVAVVLNVVASFLHAGREYDLGQLKELVHTIQD